MDSSVRIFVIISHISTPPFSASFRAWCSFAVDISGKAACKKPKGELNECADDADDAELPVVTVFSLSGVVQLEIVSSNWEVRWVSENSECCDSSACRESSPSVARSKSIWSGVGVTLLPWVSDSISTSRAAINDESRVGENSFFQVYQGQFRNTRALI